MGLLHSHLYILQEFSSLENTQSTSQMLKDGGPGAERGLGWQQAPCFDTKSLDAASLPGSFHPGAVCPTEAGVVSPDGPILALRK